MQTEALVALISATAGLLGAVVGGIPGLVAQSSERRMRQQQERTARHDALSERRRECFSDFLVKIEVFREAARVARASLDTSASATARAEAQTKHEAAWTDVAQAVGTVQMLAGEEVGDAADAVWTAAAEHSNAVDARHELGASQDERARKASARCEVTGKRLVVARRAFTAAARKALELPEQRTKEGLPTLVR